MKKIIIVGKASYIGESLYRWLKLYPERYYVQLVSPLDGEWKNADYSNVDTVINLAGIAHINKITEDMRDLFYSVNRDLAIEIGNYSKQHGVKQFVQFSSMNVYGDYSEHIVDLYSENPTSFYGDSKYQGDIGLRKLADESFVVAHIRPPFVYGKGCKGNYNGISKIAQKTPVFPTYRNRKSMIYIDNLCEFVRLVIDSKQGGIFAPQNKELVSTCDLVREIAKTHNRKIWFTGLFNWAIGPACKMTRFVRRAFADDCYAQELSDYWDYSYCVVDFEESIRRTENVL